MLFVFALLFLTQGSEVSIQPQNRLDFVAIPYAYNWFRVGRTRYRLRLLPEKTKFEIEPNAFDSVKHSTITENVFFVPSPVDKCEEWTSLLCETGAKALCCTNKTGVQRFTAADHPTVLRCFEEKELQTHTLHRIVSVHVPAVGELFLDADETPIERLFFVQSSSCVFSKVAATTFCLKTGQREAPLLDYSHYFFVRTDPPLLVHQRWVGEPNNENCDKLNFRPAKTKPDCAAPVGTCLGARLADFLAEKVHSADRFGFGPGVFFVPVSKFRVALHADEALLSETDASNPLFARLGLTVTVFPGSGELGEVRIAVRKRRMGELVFALVLLERPLLGDSFDFGSSAGLCSTFRATPRLLFNRLAEHEISKSFRFLYLQAANLERTAVCYACLLDGEGFLLAETAVKVQLRARLLFRYKHTSLLSPVFRVFVVFWEGSTETVEFLDKLRTLSGRLLQPTVVGFVLCFWLLSNCLRSIK